MNSLNILSARVIGQTPPNSPSTYRHRSFSEGTLTKGSFESQPRRSASQHVKGGQTSVTTEEESQPIDLQANGYGKIETSHNDTDEKTPLLNGIQSATKSNSKYGKINLVTSRIMNAIAGYVKWIISTLVAPGVYIARYLYDERGNFSPFHTMREFGQGFSKRAEHKSMPQTVGLSGRSGHSEKKIAPGLEARAGKRNSITKLARRKLQATESFSSATSDSDLEGGSRTRSVDNLPKNQASSLAVDSADNSTTARRSIRIKLYNGDTARRRRGNKAQGNSTTSADSPANISAKQSALTAVNVKSPTSPISSSLRMTRYPRALAPPRPLIPRRQPSYSSQISPRSSSRLAQKTLVIDLDETLIHSLAKGGRMSSGHMVEVKLSSAVGYGGATLGPQHPILYYVHKRPHCDDFLRKVCKWYNLVVFTASVQEYADPVIDWLEQERKYFSERFYRQHCTFRNGAYIKDLSSVEPDLSKVMIVDNSPLSYIFHEGMTLDDALG